MVQSVSQLQRGAIVGHEPEEETFVEAHQVVDTPQPLAGGGYGERLGVSAEMIRWYFERRMQANIRQNGDDPRATGASAKYEAQLLERKEPASLTSPPTQPLASAALESDVSYDRFDKTLDYMFNEMVTNSRSDTVKGIKAQLDYANYLMHPKGFWEHITAALAQAGGDNAAIHINAALIQWGLKVRPGGDWDHKPKLAEMLGLKKENDYYFPIRGDSQHEVFYDIWSNIHYGYVGSAAGFDAKTLQEGAAVADGIAGRNDPVDVLTVQIGIDLWNKYGDKLTKEQLHQEILNRLPDILRAQESPEYVKINGNFRHVIDVKRGNGR